MSSESALPIDGAPAGASRLGATLRERVRALGRVRPELALLLAAAAALNLWSLSRNGWANEYYSAAVRSMASSWHAFLYGSFDAGGVMTVDKPPLSSWVQALSVRVFGFHPLAILVPQALMGVATVGLAYDMVARRFGRVGGAVAGAVLTLTPITVAISRHNNPDALLVLCSVAAVWCLVRALENGGTRWLALSGVCVGLGFETKMGAALLVVPGIVAAWLWVRPRGPRVALAQVGAFLGALVAVGGAWPLLVALTPAKDRPWISGTSDNSIWSLITDYNGLGRIDGQSGGPGGAGGFGGGGGAGGVFGGPTGPFRLLEQSLGGQAGWLLGLALVAGLGVLAATRLRRSDARSGWLVATGGAFLTTAVAFSYAKGIFHPYYVSALAPWTAGLAGAGSAEMLRRDAVWRVAGPAALLAGAGTELAVIAHEHTMTGLRPLVIVVALGAAAALAVVGDARVRRAVVAVALAVLLIAPATWSVQTLGHAASGTFPAGGPASAGMGFGGGPGAGFRQGGGSSGPGFGGRPGAGAAPQGAFRGRSGAGRQLGSGRFGGGAPGAGVPGSGFGGRSQGGRSQGQGFGGGGFGGRGGGFGGGVFDREAGGLSEALSYAKAHGGGTVAVSSQSGAASAIIRSGAHVAGIGGFSGRESEVTASWLADMVAQGKIRWVVGDGGQGSLGFDGRVGARSAMQAVAEACRAVTTDSGTTLYDCAGRAAALRSTG
ncbi:MAG TPA: glycosyltransferase family 39 protein [Solirubrobacteraceae bacterium]|nr:glycosyltransferase family 39 protein [Solirubrobacteraceae bacterium]